MCKSACVLSVRNTNGVAGRADLSSYLKRCPDGPCVEKGIGLPVIFCSISACCSVLSYS